MSLPPITALPASVRLRLARCEQQLFTSTRTSTVPDPGGEGGGPVAPVLVRAGCRFAVHGWFAQAGLEGVSSLR